MMSRRAKPMPKAAAAIIGVRSRPAIFRAAVAPSVMTMTLEVRPATIWISLCSSSRPAEVIRFSTEFLTTLAKTKEIISTINAVNQRGIA